MRAQDAVTEAINGKGCLGKCDPDEPVFTLVARDVLAAGAIRDWADRLETRAVALGLHDAAMMAKIAEARQCALAMDRWRQANGGGKLPD